MFCLFVVKPMRGIETVKLAIQKLQPSSCYLTSVHADLAQLCLVSKCLKPALPFLDSDISEFVQEVCSLAVHEVQCISDVGCVIM